MLEKYDLKQKIAKKQYDEISAQLEIKLGSLQRQARALNIPIIIVFEGWDAAGKGTLINKLLLTMDARGYNVYPTNPPNREERLRPFLWRFWLNTPAKGRITIFDRSWYGRVLVERVEKITKKKVWSKAYSEIKSFERQLADHDYVIIKFFLHISSQEQKKRFKKLSINKYTAWKVGKAERKAHKKYIQYTKVIEEMLVKTDTPFAPWTVIEAHDRRFATIKMVNTVIQTVQNKLKTVKSKKRVTKTRKKSEKEEAALTSSIIDKLDMSKELSREKYEMLLDKYRKRIRELAHEIYVKRLPVVIVYEGCDAAGKGGNIRRLVQSMDPRGYDVVPIGEPNDTEKAHHYLWRFWKEIPKAGHIAIFDRSWYGRVLVERVESFCKEQEWKQAYHEINEMEMQFTNYDTVLIKFWLQIDKQEQLKRFKHRQSISHKRWKITDDDWRNRDKWDKYKEAVDEMLFRTSTPYAPWTIIESNCKLYARIKALKEVVRAIEEGL